MNIRKYRCYQTLAKTAYLLLKQRKNLSKIQMEMQQEYYSLIVPRATNKSKMVICMLDGRALHGGLSDRLMGIISTYKVCKLLNLDFRIHFVKPFFLNDYLVPNKIDWKISYEEISYHSKDVLPIFLNTLGVLFEKGMQRKWLLKELSRDYKQFHIYTNACFSLDKSYSKLYNELFVPSERIQAALQFYLKEIGSEYISVSLRFLQLLGDFKDDNFPVLSKSEAEILISKCIKQIVKLHTQYPGYRLLVASDSISFLKKIEHFDFTYIIPGIPVHVDYATDNSFELHKKTFIDFLMIANAKKIFLLQTGKMYKSNFPKSASYVNNVPFKLIRF